MILESRPEAVDCIKSGRRHVIKGAPVIRNEISGPEPFEKGQSIGTGEMSFPETRFPPRCMPDRKESQVETSSVGSQVMFDEVGGIGSERRITGKKAGGFNSLY